MVPKGWSLSRVSDICKLQNGNSFKPHDWDVHGLPIIRIQNLNGSENFNYFSGIPEDKWIVEPGQLLFAWAGTKGVSFGPFVWNGSKGVLNQHIYKVFSKSGVDADWAYLILRWVTNQIESRAHGFKATLLHVQKKDIEEQAVLLPPLDEQKKIAQILSTWDKAITATEQLLANSQQQKKALMQQLLTGKKRFPGFEGEWKSSSLKKLVTISKGQQLNRDTLDESGLFPVINGGVTPSGYTDQGNCKANTITISEGGNSCGYVAFQKHEFWCGGHCYALADLKLPVDYLYQLLKFSESRIMRLRVGSGLPNIQKKDLEALIVAFSVDSNEQMRVAEFLAAADQEVEALQSQLDGLKQEKKALMQQLLTGKCRVLV